MPSNLMYCDYKNNTIGLHKKNYFYIMRSYLYGESSLMHGSEE